MGTKVHEVCLNFQLLFQFYNPDETSHILYFNQENRVATHTPACTGRNGTKTIGFKRMWKIWCFECRIYTTMQARPVSESVGRAHVESHLTGINSQVNMTTRNILNRSNLHLQASDDYFKFCIDKRFARLESLCQACRRVKPKYPNAIEVCAYPEKLYENKQERCFIFEIVLPLHKRERSKLRLRRSPPA